MNKTTIMMQKTDSYPGPNSIKRHILPNGIVLLIYENFAAPTVEIEGSIRAGSLTEERESAGRANFASRMLLRGTEKRDFDTLFEQMETNAISVGFGSGRHTTSFGASGLAEDFPLMLDMLHQSICHPTFPEAQIEQLRGELLNGIQMRNNNTGQMARLAFFDTLYPNHPYGISVRGYEDSIARITQADLRRYHTDYYGPKGMMITIVGAVNAATVLQQVTAVLGNWENPGQKSIPELPPIAPPVGRITKEIPMPGKMQSDIMLGVLGPLRSAPDFFDLRLANTILGVFAMMGRLGENIREQQGLAYYIGSQLSSSIGPYPWLVNTGVAPEKVEIAINSILAEIRRMQEELVPEDELADSIAYLTGSLPVGLETNSGLASVISDMEFFNLGLDYLQNYNTHVRSVTPEKVRAAAQKYFSTENLVIAVAGPPLETSATTD